MLRHQSHGREQQQGVVFRRCFFSLKARCLQIVYQPTSFSLLPGKTILYSASCSSNNKPSHAFLFRPMDIEMLLQLMTLV